MVCQALSYMSICSHSLVPYTIITPFYGRKNPTLEKLSNFSKVTQPSNGKLGFKPGSLTERLSTQKCFFDSWFSPCKQSGKRQLHDKNLDITTIIIIITIITANRDLCHCVRGTAQNAQKTKRHWPHCMSELDPLTLQIASNASTTTQQFLLTSPSSQECTSSWLPLFASALPLIYYFLSCIVFIYILIQPSLCSLLSLLPGWLLHIF